MEDRITIETPERVHLHYELGGLGSRGLACLVDTLLQGVALTLLVLALSWINALTKAANLTGVTVAIVLAAATSLVTLVYYLVCEMTMDGQSPGKRMAGLRVVRVDGAPITFLDSAVRNILRLVDMLPLFYTVGAIAVFFSRQSQRLGDLAAGTVVVKERVHELAEKALAPPPSASLPGLPPELVAALRGSANLLSEADCAAAQRFLDRRLELEPTVRVQLAQRLAAPLAAKLSGIELTVFPSPERFLEAVIAVRNHASGLPLR